jgi:protocatechuate 3,4-dioxygenase beta subunit
MNTQRPRRVEQPGQSGGKQERIMGGFNKAEWVRGVAFAIMVALAEPVLTAEKASIHGRVLDAGGKPVQGAEVYLVNPRPFEPAVVATANSDATGAFEFSAELPADSPANPFYCQTLVAGKGLGSERVDPGNECELRLRPPTRITLTILGPAHKPVAGMKVFPTFFTSGSLRGMADGSRGRMFYMPPCPAILPHLTGTTDIDGKITFNDFPQACKFDFQFDDERFAFPNYSKRVSTSENQAESAPVTIELAPGATVSGAVKYGPDGKGAGGIQVLVQATSRGMMTLNSGAARTDSDGNYRIAHLIPGEYNVMLRLETEVQKDWAAAAHEWVKVGEGQTVKDIDFSLVRGGIIKGTVITADTAEPVATSVGVHGPAHPQSSSMIASVRTDAEGEYSIRVPPGLQHVYISGLLPDAYRQPRQDIRDVAVDEGQTVRLDFRLRRRDGEDVKGVVIGVDGKPAAGVMVHASSEHGMFDGSFAKTNADGRFHFDAIPANTQLEVKYGEVRSAEPVVVQRGQGEVRLQLVPRMKLSLEGLVTDEEGKPVANARIRLSIWQGNMGYSETDPRLTDGNGRYELKDLYADSRYTLAAEADGFGEKQADLQPDPNTRKLPTLALPRADAVVGGVVVDEERKPVPGVRVELSNGMSPKTAVTDAQGRFSFQIVSGTRHAVSIRARERDRTGPHADVIGGKTDLKLVLPKSGQ